MMWMYAQYAFTHALHMPHMYATYAMMWGWAGAIRGVCVYVYTEIHRSGKMKC